MAKKRFVAVILSSFLAGAGWAATPIPSVIATPPQPIWNELTVQQKTVLAPLGGDWDAMEYYRRKKWIGIAVRFPAMTPDEQRRVQGQMQEWGKLTPDQRRLAREKFQAVTQMPTEKKQELKQKWEEYSNLSDEEKEKHKQQAASKPVAKPERPVVVGGVPLATQNPTQAPSDASTTSGAGAQGAAAATADTAAGTTPRP